MTARDAFKLQFRNLRRYGVVSKATTQAAAAAACAAFFDVKGIDYKTRTGYIADQLFSAYA